MTKTMMATARSRERRSSSQGESLDTPFCVERGFSLFPFTGLYGAKGVVILQRKNFAAG